jgi:hypothetical protein
MAVKAALVRAAFVVFGRCYERFEAAEEVVSPFLADGAVAIGGDAKKNRKSKSFC